MKTPSTLLFSLSVTLLTSSSAGAYTWPSPQYDALEKMLYEGRRLDGKSLSDLAAGCKTRSGKNGGVVAAEWLRFAFHDFAAYNAASQTGGLDASVFYELDRPENAGVSMTSSAADFLQFEGKYISRADLVALGTVLGTASCGGQNIPFRGGRPSATAGGAYGVPGIDQMVSAYTDRFRTAGMSGSEMITLIACGHTIGGIRNKEVPVLFSPSVAKQEVYQHFDSTGTKFDLTVGSEYLAGKTKNPLVTAANVTLRSDARIFGSDGGATLRNLTSSPSKGLSACKNTLQKMIHSVPKEASLTETIQILPVKVIEPRLTVENGRLIFQTDLRLTQAIGSKTPSNRVVTLFWCDARGSNANCNKTMNTAKAAATSVPPSSPIALQEGFYFNQYSFRVPVSAAKSVDNFWFTVKDGSASVKTYTNDKKFYTVKQDSIIFAPRLAGSSSKASHASHGHGHGHGHMGSLSMSSSSSSQDVVVGIRSELSPSTVVVDSIELSKSNTKQPAKASTVLTLSKTLKPIDGYKFYTGCVRADPSGLTFDIKATIGGTTYTEEYLSPKTNSYIPYTTSSVVSASVPA